MRAESPKLRVKIGVDEFKFTVSSDGEGLVFVFVHSADGSLTLLVPNAESVTVKVRKGQPWRFPTATGLYLPADEPTGSSQLLLMVSAHQRSHEVLGLKFENLVRQFPPAEALAKLATRNPGTSLVAGRVICPNNTACTDEYGATILRFETIR